MCWICNFHVGMFLFFFHLLRQDTFRDLGRCCMGIGLHTQDGFRPVGAPGSDTPRVLTLAGPVVDMYGCLSFIFINFAKIRFEIRAVFVWVYVCIRQDGFRPVGAPGSDTPRVLTLAGPVGDMYGCLSFMSRNFLQIRFEIRAVFVWV